MKLCIAGSRSIDGPQGLREVRIALRDAMERFGFTMDQVTHVISGMADGVDMIAYKRAKQLGIEVIPMPADWDNVDAPGAVVKSRYRGNKLVFYNALAGHWRNKAMAELADVVVIVWDGRSTGTKNMIGECKLLGKAVHIHTVRWI